MRRRVLRASGVLMGLVLLAGAMLLLKPPCLILRYTGLYCAGCGTQHMVLALLRGDFADALGQNLYMLVLLPLSCVYIVAELTRYVLGKRPLYRFGAFIPALCVVLIAGLAFTVLRNLPDLRWLAPSWSAG